jgi:hypothetical protein
MRTPVSGLRMQLLDRGQAVHPVSGLRVQLLNRGERSIPVSGLRVQLLSRGAGRTVQSRQRAAHCRC